MLAAAGEDESVVPSAAAAHTGSLSSSKWRPPGLLALFRTRFEPAFWALTFLFPATVGDQRNIRVKQLFSIMTLPVDPGPRESLVEPSPAVA
jgi:hypothetical protein